MGKRKLCTGVVLGAIVGGLVTLKDPIVRRYTKRKIDMACSQLKVGLKDPAQSVKNLRIYAIECNKDIVSGLGNTINALEQVEQTLEKVVSKKDPTKSLLK